MRKSSVMNRMLRAPSIAGLVPGFAAAPAPGQKKRQAFGAWRFGLFRFCCLACAPINSFPPEAGKSRKSRRRSERAW
jgi:hypothetical protein